MKKILITGGLGFMGFHLIHKLLNDNDKVQITVIDNLSSTKINFKDTFNELEVFIKDLRECSDLKNEYQYIYHLASPVGSLGIINNNRKIAKEIIELTYKIIEITRKCKSRLLFVSSSEIYGCKGKHKETNIKYVQNITGIRNEYSLGKLLSEVILYNFSIINDFDFNIARPFNTIGEYQCSKIGFVVPMFFEKALSGEDIPVFCNGRQKRAFCHVSDVVKALILIQESESNHEIFNIGNDTNVISIINLARKIKKICKSNSKIIFIDPYKKFGKKYIEAYDKIPDISKIYNSLKWKPELNLEESLNLIHLFYKNEMKN